METVLGWVFGILILLWLVGKIVASLSKAPARFKGQDRCAYCGTRLKTGPQGVGFAPACRKCGRIQPWVAQTPVPAPPTPSPEAGQVTPPPSAPPATAAPPKWADMAGIMGQAKPQLSASSEGHEVQCRSCRQTAWVSLEQSRMNLVWKCPNCGTANPFRA